jgi:hypothetical protein
VEENQQRESGGDNFRGMDCWVGIIPCSQREGSFVPRQVAASDVPSEALMVEASPFDDAD